MNISRTQSAIFSIDHLMEATMPFSLFDYRAAQTIYLQQFLTLELFHSLWKVCGWLTPTWEWPRRSWLLGICIHWNFSLVHDKQQRVEILETVSYGWKRKGTISSAIINSTIASQSNYPKMKIKWNEEKQNPQPTSIPNSWVDEWLSIRCDG